MPVITTVRRALTTAVAVVLTLVATLLALPSATAAGPAAPSGLAPDGVAVSGLPVLQWQRASGASRYDVEVSTSDSFGTALWRASTTNRRATPTVQLPGGTLHWRVRSIGDAGASNWREASFIRQALAGPTPLTPADAALLAQPQDPALVSWTPITGATGYTVDVGTDPQFVDSTQYKSYTTQASSYVVTDPVVATTYYWRVRATLGTGVVTQWSTVWSYTVGGLAKPVLDSPADSATTNITDVVLDWLPVVGAKTYNLQISTDQNFNTIVHQRPGVTGTRYSPPTTLDNDQYYWRVSPVDSAGNTLDWQDVDVWTFRRHWPDQPALEYPADNAAVGDPFFYQWTPVPHASSYEVELSTVPDFSTIADSCSTVHTTFIPTTRTDCFPGSAGTYYWRVVAYDAPGNVISDVIAAEVRRFTYQQDLVSLTSPINGAEVEVPTLRWEPTQGAAQYHVTVTQVDTGAAVVNQRTTGTSFTPRSVLTVGKTYRWQVQSVSQSDRVSAPILPGSQPTFTVVASTATTGPTPEPSTPDGATSSRFPTLEWTPVTDATRYQVQVRRQGTIGWVPLGDWFPYPAGEDDTAAWLAPDTYEWRVDAYNGTAYLSGSSQSSTFVVVPVSAASGEGVAMSGMAAADSGKICSAALDPALPLAEQQCLDLRSTPVLTWDAQSDAGGYMVWISRDQQMTNLVGKYPTDQSMFMLPTALIDSQAGSAFYWWVQPCRMTGACIGADYAGHAFNKLSKPVEPIAPSPGSTVANDVTFTWRDYLATNQDAATPGDHQGVYSVEPDVEARSYRVEVDNDPNFQSPLESVVVDQTTYTSYATTYPEGPLYWRVQAVDGSNNPLTWSEPVAFEKRSPSVTLASPLGNVATSGTAPLRWAPLAYAASYNIEVYKNGDTIGQGANLVLSGVSKQVAFSPTRPFTVDDQSYSWRVRPRDAMNRPGQWTDLNAPAARFRVVGDAPELTAPADGSLIVGNDALFSWTGVDGASEYRFERRLVGATGLSESVRTPALAWAPTATIADGRWEWRVVARNSAGADMRASVWRRFDVDGTRPSVSTYKPASSARRSANFVATFSEPVTRVSTRTMKLFIRGRKRPLRAKVSVRNGGRTAILNPARNLRRGRVYRVLLKPGIMDKAGNRLAKFSWQVTAR